MISLRTKILESLLDDEEDLLAGGDDILNQARLNDPNSDLNKEYHNFISEQGTIVDGHILTYLSNLFGLTIGGNAKNPIKFSPISNYLIGVDTIRVYDNVNINVESDIVISSETLCKNIETSSVKLNTVKNHSDIKFENINFEFTDKHNNGFLRDFHFNIKLKNTNSTFNNNKVSFSNVNIKSNCPSININIDGLSNIPHFNSFKCNKEVYLKLNSNLFGKDSTSPINKAIYNIFDPKYKVEIENIKTGDIKYEKTKLLRIRSVLNGTSTFKLNTDPWKIKKGSKITDIIPSLPKTVTRVVFLHPEFICRMEHPNCNIPWHGPRLKNFESKLSDGWKIIFA